MDLISLIVGFVGGLVIGAGGLLFYMRWKMMSQLNAMQQDMQGMFDMTDDLMEETMEPDFEVEEKEE